jgi:hypothetical protein
MTDQTLLQQLTKFLHSPLACTLCRRYRAEPVEALGELFRRLSPRTKQPIRNPAAWVRANAVGLLRNYLRAEYRCLRQTREDQA